MMKYRMHKPIHAAITTKGLRKAALRCLVLTLLGPTTVAAMAEDLPKDATPLLAVELLQIYGGKTWQWGEGGGYFDVDGRKFRARTVGDSGESKGTGTWKITDAGKLCFTATWGDDVSPTETCFEHQASNGSIYQRRLPDGGWYIFKHAKTDPEDEYAKLVRKDLVSVTGTTN